MTTWSTLHHCSTCSSVYNKNLLKCSLLISIWIKKCFYCLSGLLHIGYRVKVQMFDHQDICCVTTVWTLCGLSEVWKSGDYYHYTIIIKASNQAHKKSYINNMKKIHLLQIKYDYEWWPTMLPAVYVNHYILKQQGPESPHWGPLRTFADTVVYAFPTVHKAILQFCFPCKQRWFICHPRQECKHTH